MKRTKLKRKTPMSHRSKKTAKRKAYKKTKSKESYWRNRADSAWRQLQLILWDNQCAVCGKTGRLEAHHLRTRSIRSSRHALLNGILLCSAHHKFSTVLSAHKAPLAFADWLSREHPAQYDFAVASKKFTGKPRKYKDVYESLAEILDACDTRTDLLEYLKDETE